MATFQEILEDIQKAEEIIPGILSLFQGFLDLFHGHVKTVTANNIDQLSNQEQEPETSETI